MFAIRQGLCPMVAATFDKGTADELLDFFPGGEIYEPFKGFEMVYIFKTDIGFTYRLYATSVEKAWREFRFEEKGFPEVEKAYTTVRIIGVYLYVENPNSPR